MIKDAKSERGDDEGGEMRECNEGKRRRESRGWKDKK